MKEELPLLFEKECNNQLRLIWIAMSSCLYNETKLRDYQSANDPKRPIDLMSPAQRNKELSRICKLINDILLRND